MPKLICLLVAGLMLVSGAANAHSWYPKECCHEHDCHPVPCGELTGTRYGLSWKGIAVFSEPMIRLSPDGACHVCAMWQQSNNILPVLPVCVYVPKATS
jgi:hypothetical protein